MSPELLQILQGGGNVALVVCVFFIHRAAERLARIEKALDILIRSGALSNAGLDDSIIRKGVLKDG